MRPTSIIKSLIDKIDSTLSISHSEVDFNTVNDKSGSESAYNNLLLPEPAAFEEVCDKSVTSSDKAVSDIFICDILADYIRDLNNANLNCILNENSENIVVSDVTPVDSENEILSASDLSEDFSEISACIPNILQPFCILKDNPFHLFSVKDLMDSTVFTHDFSSTQRSAVYYGQYPYCYGKTIHNPRPFEDNNYLLKILNYIDIVMPGIEYNSAMVHRYADGNSFMPHHCDDEKCIEQDSNIITISFGETRFVEFINTATGSVRCQKLDHGSVFSMHKSSQGLFTHSIPSDETVQGIRLSVTLRLISPPENLTVVTQQETCTPYSYISSEENVNNSEPHDNSEDGSYSSENKQVLMNSITPPPLSDSQVPQGYQVPTQPGYQVPSQQGYQVSEQFVPHHTPQDHTPLHHPPQSNPQHPPRPHHRPRQHAPYHNPHHPTPSQSRSHNHTTFKLRPKTLYISDSMFRFLNTYKLSTDEQQAVKLFYPGATACQMQTRLNHDSRFLSMNKTDITKVIVLTGSNNIDNIYFDRNGGSLHDTINDIGQFIQYLKTNIPTAEINVLNILPRKMKGKCDIINIINSDIKSLCNSSDRLRYIDTVDNYMFTHRDGKRREEFFNSTGRFGDDDVHLNRVGVLRLAKFLKYLVHNL